MSHHVHREAVHRSNCGVQKYSCKTMLNCRG
uniref:Uncharacterized protein n=1 Tax=Anguilla anguilla TaxID=7936 RepID=A0A0E9S3H1_ANGAN